MKIYTRTGDDGTTGLFGGGRVAKQHPRVEAYGEVDELNSQIGMARAWVVRSEAELGTPVSGSTNPPADGAAILAQLRDRLTAIQNDMLTLGAQLASSRPPQMSLQPADVARLEGWIDESEGVLAPLTNFIHPGGTLAAAALHQARTTCRRAERRVWTLKASLGETSAAEEGAVNEASLQFLNRLSDLLFSWGRLVNHAIGVPDILWQPRSASGPDSAEADA